MTIIAWFQIAVGGGILGLWTTLLVTRQVPEISAGKRDIWFHIAAEALTAALLLAAGIWWLIDATREPRVLSAFALGGLLYTTVNSPGYYAEQRNWPAVAMFTGLASVTTVAGAVAVLSA